MNPPLSRRITAVAAVGLAVLWGVGCIPQDKGASAEVGGSAEKTAKPPRFPETGQVPPELLVEGLVFDFTNTQGDLDLWVPMKQEARCAAQKIVDRFGVRLSDLGYEPGRSGAGLNDIALTSDERTSISGLFQSCVDMQQAIAAIFMGGGHMSPREATCMAKGLVADGFSGRFIDAWLNKTSVDPLAGDASMATSVLAHTDVCLPNTAFAWPGVKLPGDQEIVGVDDGGATDAPASDTDIYGSSDNSTTTPPDQPAGGDGLGNP